MQPQTEGSTGEDPERMGEHALPGIVFGWLASADIQAILILQGCTAIGKCVCKTSS